MRRLCSRQTNRRSNFWSEGVLKVVVRIPFTRKLSLSSPRQFVESVLDHRGIREVHVGSNFRFGHRRAGDFQLLRELAGECGIRVEGIEQVRMGQGRISSTMIRENLGLGRVEEASSMLGRPYEIRGTVVKGAGRGGRLGFPTANLQVWNELIPAVGVYVTQVQLDGSPDRIRYQHRLPSNPDTRHRSSACRGVPHS